MRPAARTPFFEFVQFETLPSTSEEAKRRARAGAAEGTVIVAREQSAGRGRQGRPWSSPPGNLYCSLILRPAVAPAQAAQLGFAAALAVGGACRRFLPKGVALAYKWPNDVLLGGGKAAGILLESETDPRGALAFIVVGIGVNLVSHPADTEFPATSLKSAGAVRDVAASAFLEALAPGLLLWYERWRGQGFAALRQGWLDSAYGLGEAIRVRLPGEEIAGRFVGLDEDGVLLLDGPTGRRRIAAAEVFPASAA